MPKAMKAREILQKVGISAEVVDLRTLVPLDKQTILDSVKKTHRALIVDEDYYSFGMSGEIAAILAEEAFDYLEAPIRRLALPDIPIPYSRVLEQAAIPSAEAIAHAARALME